MEQVKIIECPRDAWQGLTRIIPTAAKVEHLRRLVQAGFRNIDAVSFVSPKHVPQMADSEAVMQALFESLPASAEGGTGANGSSTLLQIIGIVVNEQGLDRALAVHGVAIAGYPYSISANFRRQNANMSLSESRSLVEKLQQRCAAAGRKLVVYISMAFGNPFGEPWGPEVVIEAVEWLKKTGVRTVSLADTTGVAGPKEVGDLFRGVAPIAAGMELGLHLHGRPEGAAEKVLAGFEAGCRRFDSALTGLGGCPFVGDELVGNIATETVVSVLSARGIDTGIEPWALLSALEATREMRRAYAL